MSESIKVFELAKELDIKALDLIDRVKPLGLQIKNHMASLSDEEVEKIRSFLGTSATASESTPKKKAPKTAVATKGPKAVRRKATVITRTRKGNEEAEEAREPLSPGETQVVEAPPKEEEKAPEELVASSLSDDSSVEVNDARLEAQSLEASELKVAPEELSEVNPIQAQVTPAVAAAAPTTETAEAPKRSRYSVIRVSTAEAPTRAKPLIVEEASEEFSDVFKAGNKGKGIKGKKFDEEEDAVFNVDVTKRSTFADDDFEEDKRKKSGMAPKKSSAAPALDSAMFRSTDYLRRERVYQYKKKRLAIGRVSKKTELTTAAAHKRVVEFDKEISVEDLAEQLNIKARLLKRKLHELGVDMPDEVEGFGDWFLDLETTQVVAQELSYEVRDVTFREESHIAESSLDESGAIPRSPVVTIMGHVDHGKTSLLDLIRKSSVTTGEAGGITQHIGAYTVSVDEAVANLKALQDSHSESKDSGKKKARPVKTEPANFKDIEVTKRLTFLDTPGHAAFTAMRSRGAAVTDIVIIVVAASEGVMPQTREAVEHAKAAGVPIIVAMNKMDLPDANPQKIIQQLSDLGILAEEWGGEIPFVPVSAKTGLGVDKLLEMILIQSEVMELKALAEGFGEGSIVEAKLDKGRGPVATCLVQKGLLEKGQYIVAGKQIGKIRALIDDKGRLVDSAGPSMPVQILGLDGVPDAGDKLNALKDERAARALVDYRINEEREHKAKAKKMSLEELFAKLNEGEIKELPLIIKSDVRGSGEAIEASLLKLPQEKVKIKILSNSAGGITESDVLLASASSAIILGFSVRPDTQAKRESESRGVQIKTYDIIYNLIDDVRAAMEGLLDPTIVENVLGQAEVRNVFTITKVGTVAGSYVTSGKMQRNAHARLIRDGRVIYTGKISGLKRFKDDTKEVAEGYECGISLDNYADIKAGDIVEAYLVESKVTTLTSGLGANA
jgi:translation initiation factor IF-2